MENLEAAISCRKGGREVVKISRTGWRIKNFRTGGLPIWGWGYFCWGCQHPIKCHVTVLLQLYIFIQKILE